jgi:hypothetical protein
VHLKTSTSSARTFSQNTHPPPLPTPISYSSAALSASKHSPTSTPATPSPSPTPAASTSFSVTTPRRRALPLSLRFCTATPSSLLPCLPPHLPALVFLRQNPRPHLPPRVSHPSTKPHWEFRNHSSSSISSVIPSTPTHRLTQPHPPNALLALDASLRPRD